MSYDINSLIWHFAGYIKLVEETGTYSVNYNNFSAGSLHVNIAAAHTAPASPSNLNPNTSTGKLYSVTELPDVNDEEIEAVVDQAIEDAEEFTSLNTDGIPTSLEDILSGLPIDSGSPPPLDLPAFTFTFRYIVSDTQVRTINGESVNILTDNDFLVHTSVLDANPDFEVFMPSDAELATLLELAASQTPEKLAFSSEEDLKDVALRLSEIFQEKPKDLEEYVVEDEEGEEEVFKEETEENSSEPAGSSEEAQQATAEEEESSPAEEKKAKGAYEEGSSETESSNYDADQASYEESDQDEEPEVEASSEDEEVEEVAHVEGEDNTSSDDEDTDTESATYIVQSGELISVDERDENSDDEDDEDDDNDDDSYESILHLGSNEATNVVSIVDTSEAGAGVIVVGDYYESNTIIQTNILKSDETEALSPIPEDFDADDLDDNDLENIAEFDRDTGDYIIMAPAGFGFPEYQVSVEYVDGDFFSISAIFQTNTLEDQDTFLIDQQTSNFFIETGNNTSVNAGQIIDVFQEYDLIIVMGDYNEANFIQQTNIVLDIDNVKFEGIDSDDVNLEDNILENEASITNIGGGELFSSINEGVAGLVDDVAGFKASAGYGDNELGGGIPTNFDSHFSVLYVSGDFYQFNAIVQTNIINDIDNGIFESLDSDEDDCDDKDNEFLTGENVARNEASIVDFDSQSEFQFLGGDFYEQDMLIQVDIITNSEDDIDTLIAKNVEDLVPEVVAFTGSGSDNNSSDNEPLFAPETELSDGVDMLGSMLV